MEPYEYDPDRALDLLTEVSERGQREVESVQVERVWSVGEGYFTEGCKRSRGYVAVNDR